jgi:hypothetical protein
MSTYNYQMSNIRNQLANPKPNNNKNNAESKNNVQTGKET